MRKLPWTSLMLFLAVTVVSSQTAFAQELKKQSDATSPKQARAAYLGIAVESLHPALVTHLPKTLVDGQGVLVAQVVPDSPAAEAGLKSHDILVSYGDQKLFSPEQLVKLVHADRAGNKIKVGIVRDGKLESHTLTLGTQPERVAQRPAAPSHWWQRLPHIPWHLRAPGEKEKQKEDAGDWTSFDSLTLRKLDDNHYRAEIEYLAKNGKKEHHKFEGTRDEIKGQIKAEKDLPDNEKEHLLRGLDMHEPVIPDFRYGPPFDWDPFRDFDF
ncbi:Putative serine protease HtrA [Bremerella volcania]|uniref:Serine protease HtrA n=1 Tax=Bremerella volcania TaxID=2527984 RepID=A0A518C5Y8_9BACT|nr:PDZ domain-containing protein [Bremerella volcania]QDU74638.1 Putative serine protease HtrA [Bremerella volcania]